VRTHRPALLALLLLAACGAPAARAPVRLELRAPGWVGHPADGWDAQAEPLVLRASGSARTAGDPARAAAQADAAAAQALAAATRRLLDALQHAADARLAPLLDDAARAGLRLDDAATARLLAAAAGAARLRGRWSDDESHWAWVELDAGAELLAPYEAELAARLAALSREPTAADCAALRAALAAAVAGQHRR